MVGKLLAAGLKKETQQISRNLSQKFKAEPDSQLAQMQRDIAACAEAGSMGRSKFYRPRRTDGE